ncbi:MAG: LysR family transcriptional regulator [Planctomycetaceae bacterium]|nr:LysR family transcriptional regulator [Planctomycetaceae bacterium]
MTATKSSNMPMTVRPRVKLWLESQEESVLCSGLCSMLRAVEETGSIKHAAKQVDRSYRFVWARIKEAEEALGQTLVETQVGGSGANRSELTDLARDLLREFDDLRSEVYHLVDNVFTKRLNKTLSKHQRPK